MQNGQPLLAWVTGAKSGLGHAISSNLESQGFLVRGLTRQDFDVSDESAIQAWLQTHSEVPYLLVCNAGINEPMSISHANLDKYEKIIKTNYLGHMSLVISLLPSMVANGGGRIVFVSSAYASKARIGRFAYSVSKSSMDALMRSIAIEYAPSNILANSVAPGFIATDMTLRNNTDSSIKDLLKRIPMNRLGSPAEVARLVSFLGSLDNTYITGQVINVDGGFSIT